ncbi:HK97 gp10 family phage protein [Eubacterium callanderi]|mgnify:CR=1 FL=1|uniref:HK97 gp10 family phage protein n=1 Tax=Eubacterium callanderi TaxID=53442 RepID=UPI001D139A6E|nr:HK97 gp10 family phage protein [Eubacterium callanderi]MCC3401112.1 HK97 gp10 family phage protein [Eubacterium callanderi]
MSYDLVTVQMEGVDELAAALRRGNKVKLDAILTKNLTEMHNRAKNGGTPVDTGELRKSVGVTLPNVEDSAGEVGYTKEYGPHVEFGHRTKDGGWVPGQHFLKKNLETQMPVFKADLEETVRKLCD